MRARRRSWIPSVFSPIRKFYSSCTKETRTRHANLATPNLERLENRTVMTTSASYLAGMLTITSDDNVIISVDTNNHVKISGPSGTTLDPTRTGGGTTGADEITGISIVDTGLGKTIDLSLVKKAKFTALTSASITGGAGNDTILGSDANDVITAGDGQDSVDGGEGNDTIYGGAGDDTKLDGGEGTSSSAPGNDVIFGEDGNDTIGSSIGNDIYIGGDGKDVISADGSEGHILIGGDGADTLTGGPGSDILIDGTTLHDSDMVALKAIRSAWISDSTYTSRINDLLGNNSTAANAPYYLTSTTTVDDSDTDSMLGGTGQDWFLRTKSNNTIGDLESGEWIGENSSTPAAHNDVLNVNSSVTSVTIPLSTLFINDGSPNGVIQLQGSPSSSDYGTLTQSGTNLIFNWGSTSSSITDATFSYSINNGNGDISPTAATVTIHRGAQTAPTFVGDVDGDHENEVIDFQPGNGVIKSIDHSYAGAGSQTAVNWGNVSSSSLWLSPIMGDFNGDGRKDMAARDGMTGQWNVWISGATPNPTTGLVDGQPWGRWDSGWNWTPALVGDFNGDGRDDIFGFDFTHGDFYVEASTGTGFTLESWGNIQAYLHYLTDSGTPLSPQFQVADFDGDGRQDVLVYDSLGFQWAFVLSKGLHFSTISNPYIMFANSTKIVGVGDFDGTGGDQILLQTRATSTDPYVFKLLKYSANDGSTALELSTTSWGTNSSYSYINFQTVDVDQDGRVDILGKDTLGNWIVGHNDGSTITFDNWGDYYSNSALDLSWTYTSSGVTTIVLDPTTMFDRFLDTFSWVYNNVDLQLYPGLLKGTEATRQTKAGNDWDQANLLVQDLRANGITADFAYGRITAQVSQVKQWLDLASNATDQAVIEILDKIAANPSSISGGTVTFNHAWVRVTLPGSGGKNSTFYVDPSWKFKDLQTFIGTLSYTSNVRSDYLNYWVTRDPATNPLPLPLEFFEQKVQDYLATHNGTDSRKSLADVTYNGPIHQVLFDAITAPAYTLPSTVYIDTSVPQALVTKAVLTLSNDTKTTQYWTQTVDVPSVSLSTVSVDWISPDEFGTWNNTSGTSHWYFDSNGDRIQNSSENPPNPPTFTGSAGDGIVTGDWNGNGIDQIAVYKPSTGDFYLDGGDAIWWGSGLGGDYLAHFGVTGGIAVGGDWDGDGKDDIGVYVASTQTWYLDLDGNGQFDSNSDLTINYGVAGATPIVGDWNGDGKSDLGYWSASGGTQTFHLDVDGDHTSAGDWTLSPSYTTGDVPVAGDWDGDGWTDIADFSSGVFRMMKLSTTGSVVSTTTASFGSAGDTPFAINIDPRSRGILRIDGVAQSASLSSSNPILADGTQVDLQVSRYDWDQSTGVQSTLESKDYIRPSGQILVLAIQALQQSGSLLENARTDLNNVLADAIQPSIGDQGLPVYAPRIAKEIAQLAGVQYFYTKMQSDHEIMGLTNSLIPQAAVGLGIITVSRDFDYNASNSIPYIPKVVFVDIKDMVGLPQNRVDGGLDVDVMHLVLDNSSALESHTIESLLNTDSISTIKGIALANYSNHIGPADAVNNISGDTQAHRDTINNSSQPQSIKNILLSLLAQGATLMFADKETSIGTWTGSVYLSEIVNSSITSVTYAINKDGQTYDGGYRAGIPEDDDFSLPQSSYQSFAGDPVKIDTGSYYREDTDISIPNIGKNLELVRYYGSQETDVSDSLAFRDLGFGYGWRDSYSDFLRLTKGSSWSATNFSDMGDIEWYTPKGTMFKFTRNGDGSYSAPSSLNGTLTAATALVDGVNGFKYVDVDGTTYLFETVYHDGNYYDSAGTARLISISDRYGNGVKVNYATTSYTNNHFTGTIFTNGEDTPEFFKISSVEDIKDSTHVRKLTFAYYTSTTHVHTITDSDGRVWTYNYDALRDVRNGLNAFRTVLTSVTTPSDSTTPARTIQYDYYDSNSAAIGLMKSYTDATGAITSMEYYANRKLMRTIDPVEGVNFYTYDIFHQNTFFINEKGSPEKYHYDSKGREIAKLSTDGSLETYTWYDTTDKMKSQTDAFGYTTNYVYTTAGLLDTSTAPNGIVTDYAYGTYGNATYIDRKVGGTSNQTTQNSYDSLGRLLWTKDANSNYTLYGYGTTSYASSAFGDRGLATSMTTARGISLSGGNPIVGDARFTTYYIYNVAGQLTGTVRNIDDRQFTDSYSAQGYLNSHVSATGESVSYSRDLLGESLTTTQLDSAGSTLTSIATTAIYDLDGRMISSTDALGRVTRYVYDKKGRLTGTILPDLTRIENEYDAVGNLIKTIDQIGRETRYIYDSRNRRISTVYADGSVERIRYDAGGQVIARWDGDGNEIDDTYDKMGRLVRETRPDPDSDLANSTDVALNGGQTVSTHYLYDDTIGGKLKETRQEYGTSSAHTRISILSFYDAADRLIQTVEINRLTAKIASVTNYAYDANNNLIDTKFYDVTSQNWSSSTTVLQSALDSMVSSNPSTLRETPTWYDVFDRVFRSYDAMTHFTATTYDDAGRVLTITDKLSNVTTNHYDLFGRLDSVTSPAAHSGEAAPVSHIGYDSLGRMSSQTDAMGNITQYAYDALDRKIAVTNAAGVIDATTQYLFDAAGELVSTVDPMGRADHSVYDLRGRIVRHDESDPDGVGGTKPNVTQYSYDAAGNVVKQTDAVGSVTIYGYDHWNRVQYAAAPDPDGVSGDLHPVITISGYDEWGNSTSTWQGFYSIATDGTISINIGQDLVRKIDTSTFDYKNRIATDATADPDAHLSQVNHSNPSLDSDGSGIPEKTTTYYNGFGDLVRTDTQVSTAYVIHYYKYDALGRRTEDGESNSGSATDADYITKTYTDYYDDGKIKATRTRLTYVSGVETTLDTNYTYDHLGRLETVTGADPDGAGSGTPHELVASQTSYTYDLNGNTLSKSVRIGTNDANDLAVTNYEYDALNRLISTTEPGPTNGRPVTTRTYDRAGELTSTTDAEENRTRYVYDDAGRMIQETSPEKYTRSYTYNEFGEMIKQVDRDGKITTWDYDNLGRVTLESWFNPDGALTHVIKNSYDKFGRLSDISEGSDASHLSTTLSYTYDNMDRVLTVLGVTVGTQGYSNVYTYDAHQVKQVDSYVTTSGSNGPHIESDYEFDGAQRIKGVTVRGIADTSNSVTTVARTTYDKDGNFNNTDLLNNGGNVGKILYSYDDARRLQSLTYKTNSTVISDYDVTYNAASWVMGLTTSQSIAYPDSPSAYTYDARGELTDAVYSSSSYIDDLSYDYDLTGNRVEVTDGTTSLAYETGAGNRLASDGEYSYKYDNEGHLTDKQLQVSDGSGGNVLVTVARYSWDNRGRLVQVDIWDESQLSAHPTQNGDAYRSHVVKYTYDALDHRIRRQIDNDPSTAGTYDIDERYIYDGDKLTFVVDGNSSTFDTLARYAYLPNAPATLARIGGNAYWLLTDEQGSVKDIEGIAMSNGTPAQHIRYDAFGNVVSVVGSAGGTPIAHLGYTGQELDSVTGLMNYGARWYDPKTGRFISQDPSGFDGGKDMNLYRYVGNNASTFVDLTGLVGGSPSFGGGNSPLSLFSSPISSYIPNNFSAPSPMTGLSNSSIWSTPKPDVAPIIAQQWSNTMGNMLSTSSFLANYDSQQQAKSIVYNSTGGGGTGYSSLWNTVSSVSGIVGGLSEAGLGAYATFASGGTSSLLTVPATLHGLDTAWANTKSLFTGTSQSTYTAQAVTAAASNFVSPQTAGTIGTVVDAGLGFYLPANAGNVLKNVNAARDLATSLSVGSKLDDISNSGAKVLTEFKGDPQVFVPDLSHVTGKTADARNKAIQSIIREDFQNLKLTHTPEYSPFISTGVAAKDAGTQIGKKMFSSRADLRDTIIHEELHQRWFSRGLIDHHPLGSEREAKFYKIIDRYTQMRGWTDD